jgi:hypothetical protein
MRSPNSAQQNFEDGNHDAPVAVDFFALTNAAHSISVFVLSNCSSSPPTTSPLKNDDGEDVKISYGRKNGLNGKVSSFKFETGYDE